MRKPESQRGPQLARSANATAPPFVSVVRRCAASAPRRACEDADGRRARRAFSAALPPSACGGRGRRVGRLAARTVGVGLDTYHPRGWLFGVTRVIDTRDASKELYDLCFKEGTNKMLFYKPAMEACMRFDKALIDPRILAQDANDTYLIDGRDAACVSFGKKVKAKPDLERRRFEVYLPDHFKISQRAFDNPVGRDGVFQSAVSKTYMYRIPFEPVRGNTVRGTVCPDTFHVFLSWKFINYQSNTELVLPTATMAANLNAAFAGL